VVLAGPTASGKTRVSLELAGTDFEIVSADSVQVYRFLDIGSGKPSRSQMEQVRHHCIDIVDPDCNFTAGEFIRRAGEAVEEIYGRGKIPLFVGGTGLYIDSFFKGLSHIPPVDQSIKEDLLNELGEEGLPVLYGKLARCDAALAERVHPNDRQRILRGLEVFRQCNRPLSSFYNERVPRESPRTLYLGIRVGREELHGRIGRRVDEMLAAGFVEEVRSLRERGFGPGLKSMKTIGYAEINGFLDGHIEAGDLADRIKGSTRRYAKRQMTWFGKNQGMRWFSPDDERLMKETVSQWLETVA
jgi:tRNA dimethylallyltransferase